MTQLVFQLHILYSHQVPKSVWTCFRVLHALDAKRTRASSISPNKHLDVNQCLEVAPKHRDIFRHFCMSLWQKKMLKSEKNVFDQYKAPAQRSKYTTPMLTTTPKKFFFMLATTQKVCMKANSTFCRLCYSDSHFSFMRISISWWMMKEKWTTKIWLITQPTEDVKYRVLISWYFCAFSLDLFLQTHKFFS